MPDTATIALQLFDSTRQPVGAGFKSLIRIRNGHQQEVLTKNFTGQLLVFEVEFFNNFGDDYTVIASASKHHDAGYHPVKVQQHETRQLDLMLLPKKTKYNFTRAAWTTLKRADPKLIAFIASGAPSEDDARALYDELLDGVEPQQDTLAAFHNLTTALKQAQLPQGSPFDYFKQLIWEGSAPQRDRFFAYADQRLVAQVRQARLQGEWEASPAFIHPGATSSFKQRQFGEANLQLSFHENPSDLRDIGGVACCKVEADLDYFRDKGAHLLLEVIPNAITGNKTNPKAAYLLRWIAGRHAGVPEFDPPYTLEAVAS